jgi:hypothetical protein
MWPYDSDNNIEELSTVKRILYLGTWDHIEPAVNKQFNNVKEFIFIDTQPRSENDDSNFIDGFYKQDYIQKLLDKCESLDYAYINKIVLNKNYYKQLLKKNEWSDYKNNYPDINPTLYIFKHRITGQKLKYYVSTNFEKNMTSELRKDINKTDALIVSGYFPKESLLDYFTKPKIFIGYTDTVFPIGGQRDLEFLETDCIIGYIVGSNEIKEKKYFKSYYLCSYFTNNFTKCDTITDLGYKTFIENTLDIRSQYIN